MVFSRRTALLASLGTPLLGAAAPVTNAENKLPGVSLRFGVRDFGAKGDGITDDWAAITAANAAAAEVQGTVDFASGHYRVSRTLVFRASWVGDQPQSAIVSALPSFKGSLLVDLYSNSVEQRELARMTLDANFTSGLGILGSSSNGSGTAVTYFERLSFVNSVGGVYAVGAHSIRTAPGALTGAVFMQCRWMNCAQPLNLGSNQDDVCLIGCRFMQTVTNLAHETPIVLAGQNNQLFTSFVYGASSARGSVKALIGLGAYPVTVTGLFVECVPGAQITHLFAQMYPSVCASIQSVRFGATSLHGFRALFSVFLAESSRLESSSVDINAVQVRAESLRTAIFDLRSSAEGKNAGLLLTFRGCDSFKQSLRISGVSPRSKSSITLQGMHRGVEQSGRLQQRSRFQTIKGLERARSLP